VAGRLGASELRPYCCPLTTASWKEQQPSTTRLVAWAGRKSKITHCTLRLVRPFSSATTDAILTVNSVSWARHELHAISACTSSDGKISALTFKGAVRPWGSGVHTIGCNAVSESWAPAARAGSLLCTQRGWQLPPAHTYILLLLIVLTEISFAYCTHLEFRFCLLYLLKFHLLIVLT
jgi:hypothetical protein